jgi:hypothetical protein
MTVHIDLKKIYFSYFQKQNRNFLLHLQQIQIKIVQQEVKPLMKKLNLNLLLLFLYQFVTNIINRPQV